MSIVALLRRFDEPVIDVTHVGDAVADVQPEPPPLMLQLTRAETLLDVAFRARLFRIGTGWCDSPAVDERFLDTTLTDAVEAAIAVD
jgi:hypothetical protein